MRINTTEEQGKEAIKNLLVLTGTKKKKNKYELIQEEVLKEVFGE